MVVVDTRGEPGVDLFRLAGFDGQRVDTTIPIEQEVFPVP